MKEQESTDTNFTEIEPQQERKEIHLSSWAVNDWITLSNHMVSAENLIQFKIRLEKDLNSKVYKFDPSSYY